MVLSWLVLILSLLRYRKSVLVYAILDMQPRGGFAFTVKSLRWFQTLFLKQTALRFASPRKKTGRSAFYACPRPFFRVFGGQEKR